MKLKKSDLILYAVTSSRQLNGGTLAEKVEQAILGGATCVQVREKNMPEEELLKRAIEVVEICRRYCIPVIINDSVEVALKSGADGVHLGQSDCNVESARKLLGANKIIGVTAKTPEEAVKAQNDGADYLGTGAAFATQTKTDTYTISYEDICKIVRSVSIPVVAIGGIDETNIMELRGSGISGVAVVSAIFSSDNVQESTKILRGLSERLQEELYA